MKTVEQIAIDNGAHHETERKVIGGTFEFPNYIFLQKYTFNKKQLEATCKEYHQMMIDEVEVVGYKTKRGAIYRGRCIDEAKGEIALIAKNKDKS